MAEFDINSGGKRYKVTAENQSSAEAAVARDQVNDAAGGAFVAVLFPLLVVFAVCTISWVAVKQYTFYVVPIAVFFILGKALMLLGKKGSYGILILLLAIIGCILFGKFIYYPNVVEPSPFTADYLVSEAALNAKRNGKGEELALLPSGEKVTVNGITRDRAEFNITAKDGTTGWIPAAAFPEDANVKPDDIGSMMKKWIPFVGRDMQQEFARDAMIRGDRDWFNRIEAVIDYFIGNPKFQVEDYDSRVMLPDTKNMQLYDDVWPRFSSIHGLTSSMMNRAVQVNQPFAVTIDGSRGEKKFSGDVEMTLWYVLYAPEATIIAFNQGDHEFANEFGRDSSKESEYHESLVLKDLDTGETFPFAAVTGSVGPGKEYFYIFPPVTTRHFALIHEKPNTLKKDYDVWDIPEVTIAANAPTMANDPFVVRQRRIMNFKGNGSNAITTQENRLYADLTYAVTLAVLPAGEIVTILEEDIPASAFMKVRYKDLEGYFQETYLKQ